MKKVLFVATVVKTHIMEFHIPYLKKLKEMGYEVDVAAKNDYTNKEDCVIPFCDNYFNIPFDRNPFSSDNIKSYKILKDIIDSGEYDIVHCHTPVGGAIARLAAIQARKKGTKVFYTAHGFHFFKGSPKINWFVYYPVENLLSNFTDLLITINKEDYNRAKKFNANRLEYLPGVGIEISKFEKCTVDFIEKKLEIGLPENSFVVLSVGELNANKNHISVIKAFSELNEDIHYVIAGDGELKQYLQEQIDELGLSKRIHLIGYRSDVNELYKVSDVLIHPSLREGLPVVVMEAMASGLPVICSSVRGNNDLIINMQNGLNIVINNDNIVKSIKTIYENEELKSDFVTESQKRIKEYNITEIIDRFSEFYR